MWRFGYGSLDTNSLVATLCIFEMGLQQVNSLVAEGSLPEPRKPRTKGPVSEVQRSGHSKAYINSFAMGKSGGFWARLICATVYLGLVGMVCHRMNMGFRQLTGL